MDEEEKRINESWDRTENWHRWGPYLSERQWGTVREDYSADGNCWDYFPHDHARSRAYRWGEDGILGITDRQCRLCFALSMWNGNDTILKERLYGLNGYEGNHGEDVKELYYYLDATPTASYLKGLYKYPQQQYPYAKILAENKKRNRIEKEYELTDTGLFDNNDYFDVQVEYAKAAANDICIRITVTNKSAKSATLSMLPTLWYRNTWIWGCSHEGCGLKPSLRLDGDQIIAEHESLENFYFSYDKDPDAILFTENETNSNKLFGIGNYTPYLKDAFHDYVISDKKDAVNPNGQGTKTALLYKMELAAGESQHIDIRLANQQTPRAELFGENFETILNDRIKEADVFFNARCHEKYPHIERQTHAGLIWSKQFYHYIVKDWLDGDAHQPDPPEGRSEGRNKQWGHLYNRDIISMPDKWEYPWYAAWDLAFHMIPFTLTDPQFAKEQLLLFTREWYMHPNGQIPAYEFAFGDVNPPVHAWAAWRVYKMAAKRGERDHVFLSRIFQKMLINFTWWVNRKDPHGDNVFAGGFLGMDNIGLFDRSQDLPHGGQLEQADGTAWMAFYCSSMLSIALELAKTNPAAEDTASKFFEHFIAISDAINSISGTGLWDEEEGFYYDQLKIEDQKIPLKVRSLVGLIPVLAVLVIDEDEMDKLPGFKKRVDWFIKYRQDLSKDISYFESDQKHRRLLAIPSKPHLKRVLAYMLDEDEFLSDYGIRSLSKYYKDNPYTLDIQGETYSVSYAPGESETPMLFGGNSNWRGPIWFPINYLIIEALETYYYFYRDDFQIECPTNSGNFMNLKEVATLIAKRLISIFELEKNRRPLNGDCSLYEQDDWQNLILFYEYFNGDTGEGIGASHQTGWTALVSKLIEKYSD